jgi:hypothetical protein
MWLACLAVGSEVALIRLLAILALLLLPGAAIVQTPPYN